MNEVRRQSSSNMGLLQAKYDSEAGWLTRLAMHRFYKTLGRMLDRVQAHAILDAGCGEGVILSRFLVERFPSVIGADLDIKRLNHARQNTADQVLLAANLQQLPFTANAFDLVLALEVLEHVGDPEAALRELHRITRRTVILSVPNEPFWRLGNMARGAYWRHFGNTPEHINHWSVWGFKRFVARYFTVVETATPVTWTFVKAEKRPGQANSE